MLSDGNLFLFSTNPWISFVIGEEFYPTGHFVWCSSIFDSAMISKFMAPAPPTSTPKDIYLSLLAEVSRRDRHSLKIANLREGLIRGAQERHSASEISDKCLEEIKEMVVEAETADFRPLLYVISYARVKDIVKGVPVSQRAHPLSEEYVIERLPADCFEALDLA